MVSAIHNNNIYCIIYEQNKVEKISLHRYRITFNWHLYIGKRYLLVLRSNSNFMKNKISKYDQSGRIISEINLIRYILFQNFIIVILMHFSLYWFSRRDCVFYAWRPAASKKPYLKADDKHSSLFLINSNWFFCKNLYVW